MRVSLPAGPSFSSSAVSITPTPTSEGFFACRITGLNSTNQSVSRAGAISSQSSLQSNSPRIAGPLGLPFNSHVSATGGNASLGRTNASGTLPSGLVLNPTTAQINGTPASSSTFIHAVPTHSGTEFIERDSWIHILARDTFPTPGCPLPDASSSSSFSSSASMKSPVAPAHF
ncbi:MAG: putative Ig domain-containing protein [Acidobacteriota bacterium]